jgi:uncharacterized integral membrane protein
MRAKSSVGGGTHGSRGSAVTAGRIIVLVLAVLAIVFIVQNTQSTTIRVLIPEVIMPLWLALLGTGVIGALCGALFLSRRR